MAKAKKQTPTSELARLALVVDSELASDVSDDDLAAFAAAEKRDTRILRLVRIERVRNTQVAAPVAEVMPEPEPEPVEVVEEEKAPEANYNPITRDQAAAMMAASFAAFDSMDDDEDEED